MSAHLLRRSAAVAVAVAVLGAVSLPGAAAASPAALADPPGGALDWLTGELAADGGALKTSFDAGPDGIQSFDDWGLTIDAVLALAAAGRGGQAAATTAVDLLEAHVGDYVTSGSFGPDDRYAGALAKTLLVAEVQGLDVDDFGGFDLDDELRARLSGAGSDAGRFTDLTGFGDFSNGFGQALAVMALARTSAGVPSSAVTFLLAQQCPGGGFRGDYTTSGGCTADPSATVDATGFALQALLSVDPTCATRQAASDAVDWLLASQNGSGAFGGESGSNTNSTGVAAVALRSLGETAAADQAAAFIAGLQLASGEDTGAIALNAAGQAAAADGVQALERDGFRRATSQGVLAFGLPTYAEIGGVTVDPGAATPCPVEPPPPTGTATGTLSATTVLPGGQLTVSGSGFLPGEAVTATLHSAPILLATLTADADGAVSLTFTVPADIEPGVHTVDLVGQQSGRTVSLQFEVQGVQTPRTLPATGTTSGPATAVGAALVLTGAACLVARRRLCTVHP